MILRERKGECIIVTNELQIFENAEFGKMRAVVEDGAPYFAGKDVGYAATNQATCNHVDEDDKLTRHFNGSGQNR
jgi:toxin-antitoxin system, toxin component, bro family